MFRFIELNFQAIFWDFFFFFWICKKFEKNPCFRSKVQKNQFNSNLFWNHPHFHFLHTHHLFQFRSNFAYFFELHLIAFIANYFTFIHVFFFHKHKQHLDWCSGADMCMGGMFIGPTDPYNVTEACVNRKKKIMKWKKKRKEEDEKKKTGREAKINETEMIKKKLNWNLNIYNCFFRRIYEYTLQLRKLFCCELFNYESCRIYHRFSRLHW